MIASAIFLQTVVAVTPAATPARLSLFALLVKGGWIMIPLVLLFALMLFIATDSWMTLRKMATTDGQWFGGILKLIREGEYDKALARTERSASSLTGIVRAGIEARALPVAQIEEDLQVEARGVISRLESPVGYLSMIASIAPMLGFLGTIFGVINIFINISASNELSISSISDGLYQKMICSAVGLAVGILAYCAYWLLNKRVDRMVLYMDKCSNIFLRELIFSRSK